MKFNWKKSLSILLVLVLTASLLAGCAPKQETPAPETPVESAPVESKPAENKPAESKPAEDPAEAEPADYFRTRINLNDTLTGTRVSFTGDNGMVDHMLYSQLMTFDTETGAFNCDLAEKYEVSADGLVHTFTLKDQTFHDGTPITSDDVEFTFTMGIRCNAMRAGNLSNVVGYDDLKAGTTDKLAGFKKIDDKTFSFTLTAPSVVFLYGVSSSSFGILPAAYFEGVVPEEIAAADFWTNPIGSGPYKVKEMKCPDYVTLTAVEDHYEKVGIKDVLLTVYTDTVAADAALMAGEMDFAGNVDPALADVIASQNNGMEKIVMGGSYVRTLTVNISGVAGTGTNHPSLENKRVRQAIDMLLDKKAMASMFGDTAVPGACGLLSPNLVEYNDDLPPVERDVETAIQILQEENFDFSKPLRIFAYYTDQTTTDFFELVKQNLGEAGIEVTYVQDGNFGPYFETTDYDLLYGAGSNPVRALLFNGYRVRGMTDTASGKFPFDDPEFMEYQIARYDDLLDAYLASQDPVEQKALLDQLQYNEYEDRYNFVVYYMDNIFIYNTGHVTGIPQFSRDHEDIIDLRFEDWAFAS